MIQDEQLSIDRELGGSVLTLLPNSWNAAVLLAERQSPQGESESYALRIEQNAGALGLVVPSEAVQLAVRKLFLLHRRYATGLQTASYFFRRRPDGRWSFTADFQYDED